MIVLLIFANENTTDVNSKLNWAIISITRGYYRTLLFALNSHWRYTGYTTFVLYVYQGLYHLKVSLKFNTLIPFEVSFPVVWIIVWNFVLGFSEVKWQKGQRILSWGRSFCYWSSFNTAPPSSMGITFSS